MAKSIKKKSLDKASIAYAAGSTALAAGTAVVTKNPVTIAGAFASAANLVKEIFW